MLRYFTILLIQFTFIAGAFSQAAFTYTGSPCENAEISFFDESPVIVDTWLWDFGDGSTSNEQNPKYTYSDAGTYTVKLSIQSGVLSFSDSTTLEILQNPVVDFNINTVSYSSFSRNFMDTSQTNSSLAQYVWDFGDNSDPIVSDTNTVLYKYQKAGDYTVLYKAIDTNGCQDSTSKAVTIEDIFLVPNVFTPNGDGSNDDFKVTTNGINLFEIYIYSRWGNLVFKREGHQQIIWDGKMPNGKVVNTGVYYYVINVIDSDTQYAPETGFIHVFNGKE